MGAPLTKCLGKSSRDHPAAQAGSRPRGGIYTFGYEYNFSSTFKVGKELGRGQFGTTYICTEKATGKDWAVKMIRKKTLTDEQAINDVKNEVKILKRLKGKPNVVEVYEVYEDNDNVYIVLELCQGGELFQQLHSRGKYTEADAAAIMRQILQVVADCHISGVIHRDLKPENFLFNHVGENAVLKLTDFGLSDFFKPDTVFRDVAGSAYYVAPEVLLRNYGPAADLWSCGVILYILLSGQVPFYHKTETGIFKQVLNGKLSFERQPWPSISAEAKELIVQLLDRDPKSRPSASAALNHPWIRVGGTARQAPLDINIVLNMQRFAGYNKVKQAILVRLAGEFSDDDLKHIQEQFRQLDADNSGTVTLQELLSTLSTVTTGERGDNVFSKAKIDEMMSQMDIDRNGSVDYMEFVAAAMSAHQMSRAASAELWNKRTRRVFDELDKDGNGYIDKTELLTLLGQSGDVENLMREVDKNHDGRIDYEEFKAMLFDQKPRGGKQYHYTPGALATSPAVVHANAVQ